jgi:beta-lactamase regulating signal transducer with metallopeptidase domain
MKIYRDLMVFVSILLLLSFTHLAVAYKYFQVFVHQSLYYCQEMAKVLNFQFPGGLGKVLAGGLLIATMITILKVVLTTRAVFLFRKKLFATQVVLQLQNRIVLFAHTKPQAFCFGIRNPKIYISTALVKLMNQAELEAILRHEKYHLEHRDTITLLLASIAESIFLFFPIVSDLIRIYRVKREVEADKAAMAQGSKNQSLKEVLRKLIEFEPVVRPTYAVGIAGVDTLETRIQILSDVKPAQYKIGIKNILLSIFSFGALILLIVTPVNAVELHADRQDVVILCDQPQDRFVVTKNFSSTD